MSREGEPRAPRVPGDGSDDFQIELMGRATVISLSKEEWEILLEVTEDPPKFGYLTSPEYLLLPPKVQRVVNNYVMYSLGRIR